MKPMAFCSNPASAYGTGECTTRGGLTQPVVPIMNLLPDMSRARVMTLRILDTKNSAFVDKVSIPFVPKHT